MANTLGYYNPVFYAQTALIYLKKALGMANGVYMGYDAERRTFGRGDTINIRRPMTFSVNDAPSTAQDIIPDGLQLVLSSWKEVKYRVTDKDFALSQEAFIQEHISPAAYALADYIDQDLASLAYEVGPIVTAAAATYASTDVTSTRKTLFDNLCQMNDQNMMKFMVGSAMEKDLLDSATFASWSSGAQTNVNTLQSGALGSRYGFNFFANQNVNTLNYAAFTLTSPTVNGAHAKGATSLAIAATTVNAHIFPKGFSFTIAGDTQVYACTANVTISGTAGTTIAISPPLAVAHANSDVITPATQTPITGLTTKAQNLAFHRNAFAMAFAKLPDQGILGELGVKSFAVQDPVTGIALRARLYAVGNSSEIHFALDALWGKKTLNPNLACRLRAN